MRHFPLFLDLQDRPVLVVGTAPAADAKAAQLAGAGARVRRAASQAAIGDAILVVCADADRALGTAVAAAARAQGVPVNVVDRPELCDFLWPAIVERDPVTIAISTAGASPVLARHLRARIEAAVPPAFGRLAAFAGALRARVARAIPDTALRRRFWDAVLGGRAGELVLAGDEAGARAAVDRTLLGAGDRSGHVAFVDVGTDEPDLLTLRAVRRLQEADIVVLDAGIDPRIVDLARRDAAREAAGRNGARLVALAREGRRVVRLTRGAAPPHERAALAAASIATETVPAVALPALRETGAA